MKRNKDNTIDKSLKYRLYLWSFYSVSIVMKNIFATKTFRIGYMQAPTAYIFEPISFIAQDVETETKGYKSAKVMIILGFVLNLIVALAGQLAILLPNASGPTIQSSFEVILGNMPRLFVASLTAYLVGGTLNSKIMDNLRKRNDNSLFFRAITSTIVGQFADNIIFTTLAFAGTMPYEQIVSMSLSMTVLETLYEIVFYPITKFTIKKIKEIEG